MSCVRCQSTQHDNMCISDLCKQTRPAVISALKMVGLAGKDGIVSEFSPGVFLQVCLTFTFILQHIGIFVAY